MPTIIYTESKPEDVRQLLRDLPAMLEGSMVDRHQIASSLRSRVAFAHLGLVAEAFQEKGRGRTGSDGISWDSLSPNYLAYRRPISGRRKPRGGGKAPGGNDGLLTGDQLKEWRRIYARNISRLAGKYEIGEAKSRAAAIAWTQIKKQGGKTKLADPRFGGRQAGKDYQIHVDTGTLRRSLLPADLTYLPREGRSYQPVDPNQVVENQGQVSAVGTNVPYAEALHKRRPLWPEELPDAWQLKIDEAIDSGVHMVAVLIEAGEI